MEEGNNKTYNLVVHISGLMTQLGSAWQELARAVQDTNQCKCSSPGVLGVSPLMIRGECP
jgi:hypothetical protein